jgi:hypothetical protein
MTANAQTDGYITDNPTPGKYVRLYDLKAAPGEFYNLAEKHPVVVKKLTHDLLKLLDHPSGGES